MTDNIEIHDIQNIQFGILSSDEIRNMAVCKIDSSKLSGPNSVYDDRLGYKPDTNDKCVTCGLKKECTGHFGYIDLAEPVFHPMYHKMISNFLKCFCKKCYRLVCSQDQLSLLGLTKGKGEKKFTKLLKKLSNIDMCIHCNEPQPKVLYSVKDSIISIEYRQKKDENGKISIVMSVEDVKKIFDSILDEDVELLGLDPEKIHPKNLILTSIPVIPPCSRPYVVSDGNICDDDLTYQLVEIIKINNQLLATENLNEQKRQKLIQSLKFRITTMHNNSKGKAKHPTDSRPLKCLKQRLGGKGGRIRSNLMGKRVDYSARTVIGSEPNLKLGQVGIPYEVAKIHTKPEVVTSYNKKWLTDIVNNGEANFLVTKKEDGTQTRINLQYALFRKGTELLYGDIIVKDKETYKADKKGQLIFPKNSKTINVITGEEKIQEGDRLIRNGKFIDVIYPSKKYINLKEGDIVERHLRKGDIVLLNRQPTLHKGSMLGTEVVPMPYKTFRFNLAVNKSFNADFDGDEMNIHAPQSIEAEVELRMLSETKHNIISAQESKPIIVIVQDALIASYLMTSRDFSLSRQQFYDISMKGERADGGQLYTPERVQTIQKVLKKFGKSPDVFNGRGLFSLILPYDLYYEKKNDVDPAQPVVKISQGVLIEGVLDKNILGSAHNSLIQILNKEYGYKIAANFIDNVQFIANAWLMIHGFSVGLQDCMISSEGSVSAIKNTLTQCYTKAKGIEESTQNEGIREVRVTAALSQAKDIGMTIAKNAMSSDNNFLTTVKSGAKGDFFNIAQLTGLLGQQNLEGKRVTPLLNHGKRTLPHYPFGEISKEREYESRGFIKNSFIHGLSPEEFYFHAMSGREGVCDTATGTATSGYIQRRIIKLCEDIQVKYDGTVRDSTNKIYQFSYGQTGYDPTKCIKIDSENQICDIGRLANRLNKTYENGEKINHYFEPSPEFEITEIEEKKVSSDKQKIINKLRQKYPEVPIDDKWDVEELASKLESLELEDNYSDEDEEQEELVLDDEERDEEKNEDESDDESNIDIPDEIFEEYDNYGEDD